MRPYIAILIDSFWEAVSNKVLWALLIGWSIILLGLAPFGYVTERSFQISVVDIASSSQLAEKLAKGARGEGSLATKAVVAKLEPTFLSRLKELEVKDAGRSIRTRELADELDHVVNARNLYSEEAFPTAHRRKRLENLTSQDAETISDEDLEALNRELLQLAFPAELRTPRGEQLWIGYAGFKLGQPLPFTKWQIDRYLEPLLVGFIVKLGLGVLVIFISIIVTSPIVPDTFRSGSLHLLLSKPISRVWLFLSKFFGGCIFVLVNLTFVLIGLYIIAGVRFGIWNEGLIAAIPLLLFVFVIFYSVSALVGLIWGNSIVCVVACMIFWLFCFSIGAMHDVMRQEVDSKVQISRIRDYNDRLFVVQDNGQLGVWNEQFSVWQPALESSRGGGNTRVFGPIFDTRNDLMIVKSFGFNPFEGLRSRSREISVVRLGKASAAISPADAALTNVPVASSSEEGAIGATASMGTEGGSGELSDEPKSVAEAREKARWISDLGPELPQQMFDMISFDDGIVAVCRDGLHKLDFEKIKTLEATEQKFFGVDLFSWARGNAFENITPADYIIGENTTAAVSEDGQGIVIFSSGNLDYLKMNAAGKLEVVASAKLEGDGTEAALVQMNATACVVARDGLPLVVLKSDLTNPIELDLPSGQKVRQLETRPGLNEMTVLTHAGLLWKVDCNSNSIAQLEIPFGGDCTSFHWLDSTRIWLGVGDQACLVDTESGTVEMQLSPVPTLPQRIYRWAVRPLYLVNPKPSALDNAMNYVMTGSDTMTAEIVTVDLEKAQVELDVWQPIISNLLFVVVVLGVSSIYVARREF